MKNSAILLLFCAALYSYSAHALPADSSEEADDLKIQPRFFWPGSGSWSGSNFWCQGRCHWQCWWSGFWTGWCDNTANPQCTCGGSRFPSTSTSAPTPTSAPPSTSGPVANDKPVIVPFP